MGGKWGGGGFRGTYSFVLRMACVVRGTVLGCQKSLGPSRFPRETARRKEGKGRM